MIDFTVPILEANFEMFAKRAEFGSSVNIFSFLEPLSTTTWIGIALSLTSIMAFLLIIYMLTRMKKDRSIFQFTWLSFLMLCGLYDNELLSKFRSVRILQLSWSLFVFLMISCYTANLAASLTIKKTENEVKRNSISVGISSFFLAAKQSLGVHD